jgi:hypothetical protein
MLVRLASRRLISSCSLFARLKSANDNTFGASAARSRHRPRPPRRYHLLASRPNDFGMSFNELNSAAAHSMSPSRSALGALRRQRLLLLSGSNACPYPPWVIWRIVPAIASRIPRAHGDGYAIGPMRSCHSRRCRGRATAHSRGKRRRAATCIRFDRGVARYPVAVTAVRDGRHRLYVRSRRSRWADHGRRFAAASKCHGCWQRLTMW